MLSDGAARDARDRVTGVIAAMQGFIAGNVTRKARLRTSWTWLLVAGNPALELVARTARGEDAGQEGKL
jgi:hypothetical protein